MKDTPLLGDFEVVEEPKKTPEKKPKQKPEPQVIPPEEHEPQKESGLIHDDAPTPAIDESGKGNDLVNVGAVPAVASFVPATLEEKLFASGNLDMLERYIEMRNKEEERNAKKEFDKHFAEMQGNFKPVIRGTKGYNADYATYEEILETNGKVIADHGFSFRFRKAPVPEMKGWTRFTIILSGHGHTDDNTFIDLPPLDEEARKAMKTMNNIQAVLAVETYAKRTLLTAGFGIATTDKDLDSLITPDLAMKLADEVMILKNVTSLEQLAAEYKRLASPFFQKKQMTEFNYLSQVKDARKKELEKAKPEGASGTTK